MTEQGTLSRLDRRAVLHGLSLGLAAVTMPGCRSAIAAAAGNADLLFENVALVSMASAVVLPGQAVAVRGGVIAAVVPQAQARAIRARQRIDGGGLHLMPGLTDMHVHVEGEPERDFPLYLANGVTTVRNMNARMFDHPRIRDMVQSGRLEGPRYLLSGPSLNGQNLRTEAEVEAALDRHVASGFGTVKVRGQLAPVLFDAVIRGARSRRLKVSGHALPGQPLAASLRMDSIEHAEEFLTVPGRAALEDPRRAEAVARQVAEGKTFVTPTLAVFDAISAYLDDRRLAALRAEPRLRYLPRANRDEWLDSTRNFYRARIREPAAVRSLAESVPLLQRFTGLMHNAGVPLLLGTDAAGAMVPGFSVHDELALLVASGLSPFDALRTATVNPARFLGEASKAGTIEVGKRADLVLVDGNPLADVRNAARVRGVVVGNRWRDEARLRAMLDEVANRQSPAVSPYAL